MDIAARSFAYLPTELVFLIESINRLHFTLLRSLKSLTNCAIVIIRSFTLGCMPFNFLVDLIDITTDDGQVGHRLFGFIDNSQPCYFSMSEILHFDNY